MKNIVRTIICTLFLFLVIGMIKVSAKTLSEIPNRSYVIGTYEFGPGYALTVQRVMWAARTIEGESIDDMIIYYKNYQGQWINAGTGQAIPQNELPSEFDITYTNLIMSVAYAQTLAKAELGDAYASYSQEDYTSENWMWLTAYYNDGIMNIDTASTLYWVNFSKEQAIANMAAVDTIIITDAKATLEIVFSSYVAEDYSTENWDTLVYYYDEGYAAIDAATDLTGIESASDTAIANMAAVETLAQAAADLANAKIAAKSDLNAALATYNSKDYSFGNWSLLLWHKDAGDSGIDVAADLASIESARDYALDNMASLVTLAQAAADLANAKIAAKADLSVAFGTYNSLDYLTENWDILVGYKTNGDDAIDAALDLTEVDTAKTTAIDNMALVERIS